MTMLNRPGAQAAAPIQMLKDSKWQMSFGERAALEGMLSQLRPRLSIEIGTAEGGSLARVAEHSEEVHSFDLVPPAEHIRDLPNVTFHTGDSHELLPKLLGKLEGEGQNVDFVLVDGDHSAEGVRQDILDLLESPSIGKSVIVIHDTMNETVRSGVEQVRYEGYPKVAYVELDFVAGYMFREPTLLHELWGGLGLVVTESSRSAYFQGAVRQERYYEAHDLLREARRHVVSRENGEPQDNVESLRLELRQAHGWIEDMKRSPSWRMTAPLRAAKRTLLRRGRG
jgi:hypothetical protein